MSIAQQFAVNDCNNLQYHTEYGESDLIDNTVQQCSCTTMLYNIMLYNRIATNVEHYVNVKQHLNIVILRSDRMLHTM